MLVRLGDGLIDTDEVLYARECSPGVVEVVFKNGTKVKLDSSDPEKEMTQCCVKASPHA